MLRAGLILVALLALAGCGDEKQAETTPVADPGPRRDGGVRRCRGRRRCRERMGIALRTVATARRPDARGLRAERVPRAQAGAGAVRRGAASRRGVREDRRRVRPRRAQHGAGTRTRLRSASKETYGAWSSRARCGSTSSGRPPDSRGEFVKQIGVEKHGAGGAGIAVLYLDGVTLDAETFSDADSATIFANFENAAEARPPHSSRVHERRRRGCRASVDVRALEQPVRAERGRSARASRQRGRACACRQRRTRR